MGLNFKIDPKETRKVDTALKNLEAKLKVFSSRINNSLRLNISTFTVDQRRLNTILGNALDVASNTLTFEINRFDVDQTHLNRVMSNAMMQATRFANRGATLRPGVNPRGMQDGMRGITGRGAIAAGGVGGIAARAYAPVLALGLGGYGLSQLNQRNQQVVAAQLQTQAIVQQAGGTPEQGIQSFDFLREQANRIGFNYLEAAPDFNKLISGLTGAGVGLQESQQVFKGFAELSRVNKLDQVQQNRLFRALSQVAGKGKLQAEELTGQIAEALPAGTALFAEAFQRQVGGELTGKEAISALMDAMKKGQVKSDILTFAAQIAGERAQPSLAQASKASQAEQAKFQNMVSDMAMLASKSGVESGFARLFRALSDGLKEAGPMVESLARGFDDVSKYVSFALLTVQDLQRFFQGRDSLLGDTFFPEEEDQKAAFAWMQSIKGLMSELETLGKNIYKGWEQLFALIETTPLIQKLTSATTTLTNLIGGINALAAGDYSAAKEMFASGAGTAVSYTPFGMIGNAVTGGEFSKTITPTYNPAQFVTDYKAEQARTALDAKNNYTLPGINRPLAQGQKAIDLKIDMNVDIKAANPEDFNDQFQSKFKNVLEETLLQYTQKE